MRIQIALLVFAFVAVIWAAPVQNEGNYMIKSDMVCGCQNICSNVVFVYTCCQCLAKFFAFEDLSFINGCTYMSF